MAAFQNVDVFVSDDQQTVVVTDGINIRLDWSRWVNETLADSATNATFIFHETKLNASGDAIGVAKELITTNLTERIVVKVNKESSEFYVEITCVVVSSQNSSDRAVYELSACLSHPQGRNEECFESNITVYGIEAPEPLGR